ncbi:TlpA family protein disulfide reductase [Planctomycetota bacterium]
MKQRKNGIKEYISLTLVIITLAAALVWGFSISASGDYGNGPFEPMPLEDLGPAPAFKLPDLQGGPVDSADFKGDLILVNFWGSWCKSCCDEMPALEAAYQKYKDRGFQLVAIAVEFDRTAEKRLAKATRKVEELGMTFTVVMGDDSVVKAFGGKPENFPQTYLIDRKGNLRKAVVGAHEEAYWDRLIRTALSEVR